MNITSLEIESQPEVWRRSLELLDDATRVLTRSGERVLVIGCGTSAFVAESFALLRETAGFGETDAAYASEPRPWRPYDAVIGITRSGTTTEVLQALRALPAGVRRIVVTGGGQSAKYQGRCNIPDMASQAFNGAIVYNDAKKQYESRTIGGTVPGIKRGNSLVFTTKNSTIAGTTYSTMTISPTSLVVNFTLIDGKSGEKTASTITFSK